MDLLLYYLFYYYLLLYIIYYKLQYCTPVPKVHSTIEWVVVLYQSLIWEAQSHVYSSSSQTVTKTLRFSIQNIMSPFSLWRKNIFYRSSPLKKRHTHFFAGFDIGSIWAKIMRRWEENAALRLQKVKHLLCFLRGRRFFCAILAGELLKPIQHPH